MNRPNSALVIGDGAIMHAIIIENVTVNFKKVFMIFVY